MRRTITTIFLVLLGLGLAYYAGYRYTNKEYLTEESSEVLLEQIKEVCKLTTVEGQLSEVYGYKDYYWYDVSLLRKKALIRVKADVAVGYDLEKADFFVDSKSKTIKLSGFPPAEIMSIDHDLDYYDISEGTFNSFTSEELTTLSKKAKEYVKTKAMESDLMIAAEEQKKKILDMIQSFVEVSGWSFEVSDLELQN